MTAQIANGGYKIYPKIVEDDKIEQPIDKYTPLYENSKNIKIIQDAMFGSTNEVMGTSYRSRIDDPKYQFAGKTGTAQVKKAMEDSKLNDFYEPLYDDQKNIRIVQEAMFSSTNEIMGTSYKSRIDDPKYQFAGKTGTAQVKRISKRERELDLKTFQIPYEERDHALYVAYGPYTNPRYALSIIVEHGGSGSAAAAPMATKLFKLIVDRHEYRKQLPEYKDFSI